MAKPRKIRSEHGTRVARSIVCRSCGAKDRIDFAPKEAARALCRKCAAELLGIEDAEASIFKTRKLTCTECGTVAETSWEDATTFRCKDCLAGIHTKQGDKSKRAAKVKKGVLRKRRD
jgi:ribosomal protein L34E